jgi:hypothetical protein
MLNQSILLVKDQSMCEIFINYLSIGEKADNLKTYLYFLGNRLMQVV